MSKFDWTFIKVPETGGAMGQAWLNTLAGSGKSREELIAREALQNSCDARDPTQAAAVHLKVTRRVLTPAEVKSIGKLLKVSSAIKPRISELGVGANSTFDKLLGKGHGDVSMLVIEDHNTIGLGGKLRGHLTAADHFRKLVTHLGVPDKAHGGSSGGSFGFGKSVYSTASDVHTVVYYSRFKPNDETEGVSARCIVASLFNNHAWGEDDFDGRAFFGVANKNGLPVPATDLDADELAQSLALPVRNVDEFGTTVAILGANVDLVRLRTEIENWWWPKLVDNELTVQLYDGDKPFAPPKPKSRDDLKPFISTYEIVQDRSKADPEKGQRLSKLNAIHNRQLGSWAATRLDKAFGDDEEDSRWVDSIALIRGAKMVVDYKSDIAFKHLTHIAGVFVAHPSIDNILRASEPPEHDKWGSQSQRLPEDQREIIEAVQTRLKNQVRIFQRELQPPPPPQQGKIDILERFLAQMLKPIQKKIPSKEPDDFSLDLSIERQDTIDGARLRGSVKIRLAEHSERQYLYARFKPTVVILENENRTGTGDTVPAKISVMSGEATVEGEAVLVMLTKTSPVEVGIESDFVSGDWALEFVQEIESVPDPAPVQEVEAAEGDAT